MLNININYLLFGIVFILIIILFNRKSENMADISIDANNLEAIRNLSDVAKKLQSNQGWTTAPGRLNVYDLWVENSTNIIPRGVIVPFWGSNLPKGWVRCDGNNGTPDLRNKYIMASGNTRSGNTTSGNYIQIPTKFINSAPDTSGVTTIIGVQGNTPQPANFVLDFIMKT